MRNLVIGIVVLAVAGAIAFFALAGQNDQPAPATPAQTTAAAAAVASEPTAAEPASATTTAPAETVEESAGDVEASEIEANLTLAQAAPPKTEGRFKAGEHYRELVPAQPTVTGTDKIEVVEIFWYGCSHCFAFDPYVKQWDEAKPADVEFVRLPAVWNGTLQKHAAAFYTAEILANNGKLKDPEALHDAFFKEIHVNKQPLTTDRSLEQFFGRFGVSAEDYNAAAKSFELDQKVRTAVDLTRRYKVSGVPAIVVNGRYSNISNGVRSYEDYLALVDELVELER
ncbi:MAG: thiol:disulfide interchange protein DsbA/DsbL [Pseudomonadota bacterium]